MSILKMAIKKMNYINLINKYKKNINNLKIFYNLG